MLSDRCLSCPVLFCLSVCNIGVLWLNSWMDRDETWHGGRPPPRPHCVRWGPSSPQFSAHAHCCKMAGLIKMPLGTEVGLDPGDIVLDGDQAPQKGHSPVHFSVHVCCGQMAAWIKMPLGTEVGLGSGYIVLDGGPSSPHYWKGTALSPIFRPMSGQMIAHLINCWTFVEELILRVAFIQYYCALCIKSQVNYKNSIKFHLSFAYW